MNFPPMTRIFFLLILLFVFSPVSAQIFEREDFHLSLEPTFAYSSGVLTESLYHSTDTNKKISLLEWERKVWLYGLKIGGNFKKFHFNAGVESSIPTKSGKMRDSDWLNTADYAMKTTYSVGTNYADENFDSAISFSYRFEPCDGFFVSPMAQAQYSFDSFYRKKGANGWYGQSEWSSDGKKHWWYEDEAQEFPSLNPETGKTRKLAGIDYYRHSFFAWAGLSLGFQIRRFYADFTFLASPFTYLSAEDRHHTAGEDNVFHEIQQDFFASYKFNLSLAYEISRYFDVTLDGTFLFSADIVGDLYLGWSKNVDQPSSAGTQIGSIRLGFTVKIF